MDRNFVLNPTMSHIFLFEHTYTHNMRLANIKEFKKDL